MSQIMFMDVQFYIETQFKIKRLTEKFAIQLAGVQFKLNPPEIFFSSFFGT